MNLGLLILEYDIKMYKKPAKEFEIFSEKGGDQDASPIFGRMFVYLFESNVQNMLFF